MKRCLVVKLRLNTLGSCSYNERYSSIEDTQFRSNLVQSEVLVPFIVLIEVICIFFLIFEPELTENQFSCLLNRVIVRREADLAGVLIGQLLAILLKLLEGLAFATFAAVSITSCIALLGLQERLDSEFYSDCHMIWVLCYEVNLLSGLLLT